jgi:hypothetical protein
VALQVGQALDAAQVVVGHLDAEFVLDLEHELDEGERVHTQVRERRVRIQFCRIERQLPDGKVLDAGEGVHEGSGAGARIIEYCR